MTTMDKAGIGVTIGILAVTLTLGIGFTTDVFEGIRFVFPQTVHL